MNRILAFEGSGPGFSDVSWGEVEMNKEEMSWFYFVNAVRFALKAIEAKEESFQTSYWKMAHRQTQWGWN